MTATWRALVFVAVLGVLCGCSSLPDLGPTAPAPYHLGPGDEIKLSAFGFDQITGDYIVGDTGTISVPLLGNIEANNKSTDDLEKSLADAIVAKKLVRSGAPSVTVQVTKYRPFFIMGEVQRPGQYPYVPGMTVLTAVSIAGGYTFRARTGEVAIVRTVDSKTVKGSAKPDTAVMPGDTIRVFEGWF